MTDMHAPQREHFLACEECRLAAPLDFDFTMAFQPIVDIQERTVFAYEALVRGLDGGSAAWILAHVNDQNRYRFDQACRTKAVELASRLGVECYLSINFMPNAIYEPATCIRTTLAAAKKHNFPAERLLFEVSEAEDAVDKVDAGPVRQTVARAVMGLCQSLGIDFIAEGIESRGEHEWLRCRGQVCPGLPFCEARL